MKKTSIAAFALAVALVWTVATASAGTAVSSNWSGYAVTGTTFTSVSGSWVQPTVRCSSETTGTSASAFWVGLGGDSSSSGSLEQTGTEAYCLADGTTHYSAWYELVPDAAVKVALKVSAGDRISASVTVNGTAVRVELRNLTTSRRFTKTLRMSAPDVSSAEWIAEAPSIVTPGGTLVLPLTDFGAVRFSEATATSSKRHTGTISDSAWTATRIRLASGAATGPGPGPFARFDSAQAVSEAVAGGLSQSGGTFTIRWRQVTAATVPEPFTS